jgi:benzoyl-CoA reductase/2-hydroxyglutaryl-CoA dehydratase subunit BcrC/BadD/HgdB
MKYFDFVISEVHGRRIKEIYQAKKEGKKVIGTFCVYVPEELIIALNGVSIGLCAGAEVGSNEAEKYIPRNTCPLIKHLWFKLADSVLCRTTDLLVGEIHVMVKESYEIFKYITKKSMLWKSQI